jgi:tetratricopeptide (TPR) repeat protein
MNASKRTSFLPIVVLCCLTPASVAVARAGKARKPASAKVRRRARTIFIKAKKDFALGRFKAALKKFTKAYELVPLPGLLFNIGQCQRLLGNCKKAIFLYEGYIAAEPNSPNRATVEELIEQCKKKVKEEEARKRAAARRTPSRAPARVEPRIVVKPPRPYVPEVPVKKKRRIPVYKKWWFWTAIGGGVAAAVATTLAITLSSKTQTVLPSGSLGTVDLR